MVNLKQSPLLILIIGDGKATYTQILTGSSSNVIYLNATALHVTQAVMKRRSELK